MTPHLVCEAIHRYGGILPKSAWIIHRDQVHYSGIHRQDESLSSTLDDHPLAAVSASYPLHSGYTPLPCSYSPEIHLFCVCPERETVLEMKYLVSAALQSERVSDSVSQSVQQRDHIYGLHVVHRTPFRISSRTEEEKVPVFVERVEQRYLVLFGDQLLMRRWCGEGQPL